MQTLKGRTCIMAGAAGGDGMDTVRALCMGGMNVVMMTHSIDQAQVLAKEIEEKNYPGKCIYKAGSHGPAEEDPEILEEIVKEFGSIDVVVCNTGANGRKDSIDLVSKEDLLRSIEHLAIGSYGMLKASLPYLRKSSAPRVIFMTTVEGVSGGVTESFANAVAKGCVESLTLNCATRLAKEGITVNAIAKAGIPRVGKVREGDCDPREQISVIPMNRLGTPDDLAQAICFLASEESSYITGQILNVSGGM